MADEKKNLKNEIFGLFTVKSFRHKKWSSFEHVHVSTMLNVSRY